MSRYIRFEVPYSTMVEWKRDGLVPDNWTVLHQEHTLLMLVIVKVEPRK